MIVQLSITRYVHHPETSIEIREEQDSMTLQFHDGEAPLKDDRIRTEDGRTLRVTSRIWLPDGLELRCEERVTEELAA